jgi:hypothetical protein
MNTRAHAQTIKIVTKIERTLLEIIYIKEQINNRKLSQIN